MELEVTEKDISQAKVFNFVSMYYRGEYTVRIMRGKEAIEQVWGKTRKEAIIAAINMAEALHEDF